MPACVISSHPALRRLSRVRESGRGQGVLCWFARIPDPRRPRGVRHALVVVLVIAACAVPAGCRSLAAIGQRAADLPQQILRAFGARRDPRTGMWVAPSEPTVRRALQSIDGQALDQAVCGRLAEQTGQEPALLEGLRPAVAVDGKSVRGARTNNGGGCI